MPNRAAKRRKQDRQEKDAYLRKYGRTSAQIKRKAKRAEQRKGGSNGSIQ